MLRFDHMLACVRRVIEDVRVHSALCVRITALGVTVHEQCGSVRFTGPKGIEGGECPEFSFSGRRVLSAGR